LLSSTKLKRETGTKPRKQKGKRQEMGKPNKEKRKETERTKKNIESKNNRGSQGLRKAHD
jgi:hypothetical protein